MSNSVIKLVRNDIELVISPKIGGRLVGLYYKDTENILKSDSSQWENSDTPELSAFSDFKAFNGHINWVGPQSDWWKLQDLNKERKDTAAAWPPDPFLIYSEYTITHQSPTSIVLEGMVSPISKIKFIKEYAINEDASIFVQTTMVNCSDIDVSWDIWFNTRLDGNFKGYVPVADNNSIKVIPVLSSNSQEMPYIYKDGIFSYSPQAPQAPFTERSSKAFIYPQAPIISGFVNNKMLLIHFEKHEPTAIHPEQALVEIYNHTETNTQNALLELEYHSPLYHLKPGDTCKAWQIWKVFDYKGANTFKEQTQFLSEILKNEL
ncbi:MAG: DUF4380 domain-containing protein [Bacteroidales bacterium]|nr:DUF4380 domain-containing protein [Bacteroidales bacterium]